jgi:hypothetical protein
MMLVGDTPIDEQDEKQARPPLMVRVTAIEEVLVELRAKLHRQQTLHVKNVEAITHLGRELGIELDTETFREREQICKE